MVAIAKRVVTGLFNGAVVGLALELLVSLVNGVLGFTVMPTGTGYAIGQLAGLGIQFTKDIAEEK